MTFPQSFVFLSYSPQKEKTKAQIFIISGMDHLGFSKQGLTCFYLRCKERHSRGLCPTSITKTTSGPRENNMKIWWHNDIRTWWQNEMMTGWQDDMMWWCVASLAPPMTMLIQPQSVPLRFAMIYHLAKDAALKRANTIPGNLGLAKPLPVRCLHHVSSSSPPPSLPSSS